MKLNNRRTQNKSAKRRQRQHKKSAKGKNLRKKKQTKRRTKMGGVGGTGLYGGGSCDECIRTWDKWLNEGNNIMEAFDILNSPDFQYNSSAYGCNPGCQKQLLAHLKSKQGDPYDRNY